MRAGGKANINLRIDNFWYILKYSCSPEKGCFSCVVLKRPVFCKSCYCCLMPVIFAWNFGCWSFSAKYLRAICVGIFQGKLVSILVVDSRICRFFSVFCIIFVTLDSFLSQLVIRILLLLPLWQNLMTFRNMIVFLFYRCVICVKHLNLQLNRVFSFT